MPSIFALYLFLFSILTAEAFASVLPGFSLTERNDPYDLDALKEEFKGIYWDYSHAGSENKGKCTTAQQLQLIRDIRATANMMALPFKDSPTEAEMHNSAAWDRYFGSYSWWTTNSGRDGQGQVGNLLFNIKQASKWLRNGRSSSADVWKVALTCNANHVYAGGVKKCEGESVFAVRVLSDSSASQHIELLFCPRYFTSPKLRRLDDIVNEPKSNPLNFMHIDTYERIVGHELMHVPLLNTIPKYIEDLNFPGTRMQAYGDSRCRDFARLNQPKANFNVLENADGYSLFYQFFFLEKTWGWTKPESRDTPVETHQTHESTRLASRNTLLEPIQNVPALSHNCRVQQNLPDSQGNSRIECDWIAGSYTPRLFSEENCILSEPCRESVGPTVNPECTCTCNFDFTPLRDSRCRGFSGSLSG